MKLLLLVVVIGIYLFALGLCRAAGRERTDV